MIGGKGLSGYMFIVLKKNWKPKGSRKWRWMEFWYGILSDNLWFSWPNKLWARPTSNLLSSPTWGGPSAKSIKPQAQKTMIGLKCYCFSNLIIIFTHISSARQKWPKKHKYAIKILAAQTGEATCTRGPGFFLLGKVGVLDFSGFYCDPIKFPLSSLKMLLKVFPIAPHFIPHLKPLYTTQRRRLEHIYFGNV